MGTTVPLGRRNLQPRPSQPTEYCATAVSGMLKHITCTPVTASLRAVPLPAAPCTAWRQGMLVGGGQAQSTSASSTHDVWEAVEQIDALVALVLHDLRRAGAKKIGLM